MKCGGYADVLVNVILSNGTTAEIQINVPELLSIKAHQGHKLYEVARDFPKGSEKQEEIYAAMRGMYNLAWETANKRQLAASLTLPDAANSRQPAAQLMKAASDMGAADLAGSDLTGLNSSPESSRMNTEPSGNSTNSSPLKDATNTQPGGNLSGTFISTTSGIIVADSKNPF